MSESSRFYAATEKLVMLVLVMTKHGPNGSGRDGACDANCVKCHAEKFKSQYLED